MTGRSRKPAETGPSRIEPLATLPVFWNLAGKRAVVAGGSAAAAWKAELLAAAGAHVDVYAPILDAEMARLMARKPSSGSLTYHPRSWAVDVIGGAAIALADAADEPEAKSFYDAVRTAGVPVNVIDRPAFCQFQFGAIVNRSPVVVGISTNGAAPILAQEIRRRIETLLPPTLAAWATLAKSLRYQVSKHLQPGRFRRIFWERFSGRAFGPAPSAGADHDMTNLISNLSNRVVADRGCVTLVGAGPGDAELLTLKAVRALQSADVILFDDLVSGDVLELARREAKRMLVGKRSGRVSCRQDDINALMLKLARQGKHVVRLKSGDPMIFGKAGEEIALLEDNGIAVDVVPGITSALAMAANLGVSLTHRDHAHSVRFITGHSRNGELSDDLDWRTLSDPTTTLIVYMGGRTAPVIARSLMQAGRSPNTPVALACGVSWAEEVRWTGSLSALCDGEAIYDQSQPVLIGIGAVFDLGMVSKRLNNSTTTTAELVSSQAAI